MHQKGDSTTIRTNRRTFVDKETNVLDCEIKGEETLVDFRKTTCLNKEFFAMINDDVACDSVAKGFRRAIYLDEDSCTRVEEEMTTTNFLLEDMARDEVLIGVEFFYDVDNRSNREVEL